MADTPNSFRDPYWSELAEQAGSKAGIPDGYMTALITKGERSNANQTSEAGAKTVFQITPETRNLVLKRDGIDAYLSDENAADAAAAVAKDGFNWAQQRTKDPAAVQRLAAGYYHAGGDTANWGPKTTAYMARVTGLGGDNSFSRAVAAQQPDTSNSVANVVKAYQSGKMSPEDASDFEAQVNGGHILLPRGVQLKGEAHPTGGVIGAYQSGKMTPEDAADFEGLVQSGDIKVPPGFQLKGQIPGTPNVQMPAAEPSFVDKAKGVGEAALNAVTGVIGGGLGAAGGMIGGMAGAIASGDFGSKASGDAIEQAAAQGAQSLTYAPRTATGQQYTEAVGNAMQQAIPVMPLTAEMQGLTRAAAPVVQMGADAGRAMPGAALDAAQAIPGRVGGVFRKAETGAPVTAASDIAAATPAAPAPAAPVVPPVSGEQLAATAKTAAAGNKPATAQLAGEFAPDPKRLASARRLDIEEYLQPDHLSTNQAAIELAQAVKSIPGSAGRAAEMAGLSKIADRASKLIDDIGGSTDLSSVDGTVKPRMQGVVDSLSDNADSLYKQVRERIPMTAEAPADNVLSFINKHADEVGGVENLSSLEKEIVKKLSPKTTNQKQTVAADPEQVGLMTGASVPRTETVPVTRQPSYALLDDVRKDVGAAARMKGPFADADVGLAKHLYSLIDKDQAAVAGFHGAGELLDAAQKAVSVRKGIESDMQSLFGRKLDQSMSGKIPGAVTAAARGNTAPLLNILKATPADMRQSVVATGIGTAFKAANSRGEINFGTYAKWFEGLMKNKQAYAAVMSNLPKEARRNLIDLYRVSDGISAATRERILTGRIQAVTDQFKVADSVVSRLYDTARRNAVAGAAVTAAAHVPFVGPAAAAALGSALMKGAKPEAIKAVDALIASPEFQRLVKEANTPNQTKAAHAFANSRHFNRFVRSIRAAPDMTNRTRWVLQAMRLPAPQGDNSRNH